MEVTHKLLNFKNLNIVQNTDWFNFSLDSVLLANFVDIKENKKIVDLCTGNAPIPIILSTITNNKIIGIELQKEIYDLAIKSITINNLQNKIEIINDNVKNVINIFGNESVDTITCNPPFFKVSETSNTNSNIIKSIARHEIMITVDDIFRISKIILKNGGNIAIVHRSDRLIDIISSMRRHNIEPKKIQFVYPKKDKCSNIVLIEGIKNGNPGIKVLKPIYAHKDNGEYSDEIRYMFGN